MRIVALLAVIALAIAALAALWPRNAARPEPDRCGPVDAKPWVAGVAAAGQATLCLLNRERTRRGLPPLRENGLLTAASRAHSEDMVRRRFFEHTTPDGRTVIDRLQALGYARGVSASTGENIAYGVGEQATPKSIVRIWMQSPGHREDILRPAFTEIGIGIAVGAPEVDDDRQAVSATYTTDFGGRPDPSLPTG